MKSSLLPLVISIMTEGAGAAFHCLPTDVLFLFVCKFGLSLISQSDCCSNPNSQPTKSLFLKGDCLARGRCRLVLQWVCSLCLKGTLLCYACSLQRAQFLLPLGSSKASICSLSLTAPCECSTA